MKEANLWQEPGSDEPNEDWLAEFKPIIEEDASEDRNDAKEAGNPLWFL